MIDENDSRLQAGLTGRSLGNEHAKLERDNYGAVSGGGFNHSRWLLHLKRMAAKRKGSRALDPGRF